MTENKQQTRRLAFTFENAPIGIVWHDDQGKIIQVNPHAAEKLGYSSEELKGNYLYKFVVMDTSAHDSYYGSDTEYPSRYNLFTRQGTVLPVHVHVFGATPEQGDFGCAFFADRSDVESLKHIIQRLEQEIESPGQHSAAGDTEPSQTAFKDFIGESRSIKEVIRHICRVAPTPTTVLLTGETGTGKELVAQKIHTLSNRAGERFIKVNCAALPQHLIEGELFGHEKGAFTGAHTRKPGRFELAHKGTLFLDEIGEMSLELQAKLLRVLQEGEFERLGGTRTLKVDVRIIAATNKDLEEQVKTKQFRSDLFFRLNTFPIHLPALRERQADIPALARFFADNFCTVLNRKPKVLPQPFVDKLLGYAWPGNVRELQNIIERACILSTTDQLELETLSLKAPDPAEEAQSAPLPTFEENQRQYIISVLKRTRGKVFGPDGAAVIMGLNPRTLNSKIQKLGIDKSALLF